MDSSQLKASLEEHGQAHLIQFWEELSDIEQKELAAQIATIDFAEIKQALNKSSADVDWNQLAEQAEPPQAISLNDSSSGHEAAAIELGEQALRDGKVGMILVAGGQGTRLGFDLPKGMYPLGPVSRRSLFQIIIDQLRAVESRYGTTIPLYVMTSPATHERTVSYLAENQQFGLSEDQLFVFCQGTMPAVDAESGNVVLEEKGKIAVSPDGHGGMLAAFDQSGCLADAEARGIELLFYGQIDNPLVQVADAKLLGHHLRADSELTTQVVRKRDALERVGNVVSLQGKTQIIEYSDLPEAVARKQATDGSLLLWAGNIAVHVFSLSFLQRCKAATDALPFHLAHKKVPYLDEQGRRVEPEQPNAIKLERFIFDLLPQAERAIVVEVEPRLAFAPVKNAAGAATDTAETAQNAMIDLHREMLVQAGIEVAPGVPVEVNPLFASRAEDVEARLPGLQTIDKPTYLGPSDS